MVPPPSGESYLGDKIILKTYIPGKVSSSKTSTLLRASDKDTFSLTDMIYIHKNTQNTKRKSKAGCRFVRRRLCYAFLLFKVTITEERNQYFYVIIIVRNCHGKQYLLTKRVAEI